MSIKQTEILICLITKARSGLGILTFRIVSFTIFLKLTENYTFIKVLSKK